ncbi:MAG: hypothetical protein KDB00_15465 [Planctomycetales bacterium]|nr:hypothetical protein [Planctomycetales bacterium]
MPSFTLAEPSAEPTAAAKAIEYLKTEGQSWMADQGCVSCHQIPAMVWSLGSAAGHGLDVSDEELSQWIGWSTDAVNFVRPTQREGVDIDKTLAGNIDTMSALMLAVPGQSDAPWRKQFAEKLCSEQAEDGSWKACGQLPAQKRPKLETTQATTLWVTLALMRNGTNAFDADAAIRFADEGPEAKSTEWYAVRLLVAAEQGSDQLDAHLQNLLRHQNTDGGWGWITGAKSDALATGIALYALGETGVAASAEIAKARQFLQSTQTDSGSWKVPGTKTSAKDKPTATANYWGTAWAVVGMLSTESQIP